jgi:diadenosine tetraphosphate (Ap4A) HIT family hydrolase
MPDCQGCRRAAAAREDPLFIAELGESLLFLGDHQYFPGYCVLLAKGHFRELHEMPVPAARGLNEDLMRASRAVAAAFRPWKLNHASLGNVVPHAHWHILPRYEDDPDRLQNPWLNMKNFASKVPGQAERAALIAKIREAL